MNLMIYSLLILLIVTINAIGDIDCENKYSCIGYAISISIDNCCWPNGNGYEIRGYGYKSLYGRNTSINITSNEGHHTYCLGAFSCNDISFINTLSFISCWGSNSCSNINESQYLDLAGSKSFGYQWITCLGSNSCKYSNLRSYYQANKNLVQCYGDRSCNYVHIKDISYIDVNGAYGLYGAIINTSGLINNVSITLSSYYAGFGAHIICYPQIYCNINCMVDTGCYMLYIECLGISNCIINTTSNYTMNPITNSNNFNMTTPSNDIMYNSEILTISNDYKCNNQGTQNIFDNKDERYNGPDIVINIDNHGPICCRGYQSCFNIDNIQFNTSSQDTTNIVICSGDTSCRESNINNINGDVFCEGLKSCLLSNITTNNNVYCFGMVSCYVSQLFDASNVYCSGSESCKLSVIKSFGDINIYLLGKLSGDSSTIYCNNNDKCLIVCGGFKSCSSSTIIYCYGICTVKCSIDTGCPNIISSYFPTLSPTNQTYQPSNIPTSSPVTNDQSISPTTNPSYYPTTNPSYYPTTNPSYYPTTNPSYYPTIYQPSYTPISTTSTIEQSIIPSISPTLDPTDKPSLIHTPSETNNSLAPNANKSVSFMNISFCCIYFCFFCTISLC
eukprot:432090_1